MSKVICDVCGTAYAETATQCPICGCVRSADAKVVPGTVEESSRNSGSYTYVKGGRFSKANVKKRNMANRTESSASESRQVKRENTGNVQAEKSNKGLIATVIILLLAIIAVVAYIVVRFFVPVAGVSNVELPDTTPAVSVEDSQPTEILCTSIVLGNETVTLDAVGAAALLDVQVTPKDTTDVVTFASDDEAVATVDENGKITAVAAGETIIRVTCGDMTAECKVVCEIVEVEPTEPENTEPEATEPSMPNVEYNFNTVFPNEMTLMVGTTFGLRLQDANKKSVDAVFSSANTAVCTVDADGTVHAIAKGYTTVKAEYNGQVYKCKVIVN